MTAINRHSISMNINRRQKGGPVNLRFQDRLPHQEGAIAAVTALFEGCERHLQTTPTTSTPLFGELPLTSGNALDISEDELQRNLDRVQRKMGLRNSNDASGRTFTVEMETGTGKTYVYLRTALELAKKYGLTKFMIIVPSLAIKEGVLHAAKTMRSHFEMLYPESSGYQAYAYSSTSLGDVRDFSTTPRVRFMVANVQAILDINSAAEEDNMKSRKGAQRVMHRYDERVGGEKPIELIQRMRPVVIIDEPQSVEGSSGKGKGRQAVDLLNPLIVLRYSATPKERPGQVFRLSAAAAYQQGLVKQVEVSSIEVEPTFNEPYVKLIAANKGGAKKLPTVDLELNVAIGNGHKRQIVRGLSHGEDLQRITSDPLYQGWRIGTIEARKNKETCVISMGVGDRLTLKPQEEIGGVPEEKIRRFMIQETIRRHLDRELKLRPMGIKVLSLFFVGNVSDYRRENGELGRYGQVFQEEYAALINSSKYAALLADEHLKLLMGDAMRAHDGYFSIDRKGGKNVWTDSEGEKQTGAAFELIMKDKEKLLSLEEPLRFIFSHSALREGWDNPNVFQVCSLRTMHGEQQRRQTLGRGLRLAVKNNGERVSDREINTLTVIADESYQDFARGLQAEIEEATGTSFGSIDLGLLATYSSQASVEQIVATWREQGVINEVGQLTSKGIQDMKTGILNLQEFSEHVRGNVRDHLIEVSLSVPARDIRQKRTVHLRKGIKMDPRFIQLWSRISQRTVYHIAMNAEQQAQIPRKLAEGLKNLPATMGAIATVQRGRLLMDASGVHGERGTNTAAQRIDDTYPAPLDPVTPLQEATRLKRSTICEALRLAFSEDQSTYLSYRRDPRSFIKLATEVAKELNKSILAQGVKYTATPEHVSMELIHEEFETLKQIHKSAEKGAYDLVAFDSAVEQRFAKDLDSNDDVVLYMKLPETFKVRTPFGNYNPDWAVVTKSQRMEGEVELYFVAETKGTDQTMALSSAEQAKIACAEGHFKAICKDDRGAFYVVGKEFQKMLARNQIN